MNFNAAERIALLLACQSSGAGQELDPVFIQDAITSGNDWAIKWEYDWLFSDSKKQDDIKFVVAVLDLFRAIRNIEINSTDKDLEKFNLKRENIQFSGFDGNNESELYDISSFFINKMNRWQEFKDMKLNSHSPKKDYYKEIMNKYSLLKDEISSNGQELGLAEISSVFRK
jgi:uncharacterized protein YfbU (UPF0304 family)